MGMRRTMGERGCQLGTPSRESLYVVVSLPAHLLICASCSLHNSPLYSPIRILDRW